jgi:phospholipid/cholesterol/gamma-HCH transport system substrate-binding protein
MNKRTVEVMVGLFVLLAFILLLFLALRVSGFTDNSFKNGYTVSAEFDNVGALNEGALVSIAGVKIGEIDSIVLDPTTYRADVVMQIYSKKTLLPIDSSASIYTQGILGAQYIGLTSGFAETNLQNKGEIRTTHSALILENLIGQFLFKMKK